jgi:4-oxalocrotonate tautomerase
MPFVNVRTVRGLLTDAQKRELQQRITDLMVEIEGRGEPAFRKLVWVLIDEQEPENWCLGGTPVTPEALQRLVSRESPKI